MWLYASLLFFSVLVPLVLSFDKNLQFYKQWKFVLPSITVVAAVFILFDLYYTTRGIWGFNQAYHLNIIIGGLPLEEILFFFVIPYASIFIHESVLWYFPNFKLSNHATKVISAVLLVSLLSIIALNLQKAYTVYAAGALALVIVLSFYNNTQIINKLYLTFLIILIPFLLVNGILTGSFITDEVVWYNPAEILGYRVFTIPVEDFAYGFSLIVFNLFLTEKLKTITKQNIPN
ncbi:MAG TPA: lycopene cyclase domain-containing protein [Bacteroidales bacterium]|nr:lycopene cyclase domain-containing protein [Bacteroidales bacterium]